MAPGERAGTCGDKRASRRSSAPSELQQAFCLFKLAGAIWVVEHDDIVSVRNGTGVDEVSMYRQGDGKLLMQRHLETLPVPSDTKKVVSEFMRSPHTKVYDAVAFSPLPTPSGTLNYWVGSPVAPKKGDWDSLIRRAQGEFSLLG